MHPAKNTRKLIKCVYAWNWQVYCFIFPAIFPTCFMIPFCPLRTTPPVWSNSLIGLLSDRFICILFFIYFLTFPGWSPVEMVYKARSRIESLELKPKALSFFPPQKSYLGVTSKKLGPHFGSYKSIRSFLFYFFLGKLMPTIRNLVRKLLPDVPLFNNDS